MKRFTETDKWQDPWFRSLSVLQKCIFLYVCDKCNNAGFLEIDTEQIAFALKCKKSEVEGAWQGLGRGFKESNGWIFVRTFLKHQKHMPLCPERNPAHRQILSFFKEREFEFPLLFNEVRESGYLAPTEGLHSPIGIGIGKGDGIGKGKGRKEKGGFEYHEDFLKFWNEYPNKKAKPKAYEAWSNAISKPDIGDILQSIELQKRSEQWTKDNGRFIPHPATWLNQGRWDDKPVESRSKEPCI